jgi:hypothetical protein
MKELRRQKYIETAVLDSGITVKILNAKKTFAPSRGKQSGTRNCAGRTQIGGGCPAELRSEPRRKIFGSAVYERDR